eukprot:11199651-Lingulodinium_polyedra.AAC.1
MGTTGKHTKTPRGRQPLGKTQLPNDGAEGQRHERKRPAAPPPPTPARPHGVPRTVRPPPG